jgi:hypothetical protein
MSALELGARVEPAGPMPVFVAEDHPEVLFRDRKSVV